MLPRATCQEHSAVCPNRLEQRFGCVRRIGQTEVCHMWSLVAAETREAVVFQRLLEKLEAESERLHGKVFDVLGQLFEGTPLRTLLIEAIRYGDSEEVEQRLTRQMDDLFDPGHMQELVERNALAPDAMDASRLQSIREEMERAEALRRHPRYMYGVQ